MGTMPERINVMRVMTYDVQQIVNDLIEWHGQEDGTVTLDDVMGYIEELVREDFSAMGDLIYQDEDGEEL